MIARSMIQGSRSLRGRSLLAVLPLMVLALLGGCRDRPRTVGTGYPDVTYDMLVGRTSSQRTGRESPRFVWEFMADEFRLTGEEIPLELRRDLTGGEQAVREIRGRWRIQQGQIELSGLEVDGQSLGPRKVTYKIFHTGVIRIQTDEAQYVF